jgi:acetyltransferase
LAKEILGLKTFQNVKEIARPVELAIIATPREEVPRIAHECAVAGIKCAVVVPQGFADADDQGRALQDQLSNIAAESGIRILGPNTLGVSNSFSGFTTSFMPLRREKGPVGIICQSGIFFVGSEIFTGGMGKGIDIGNGCDVDFADALEYFGEDEEIQLVFMHIEGMQHGRRFFEVAEKVARRKPVITFKTARTDRGAQAASSHSGALAGQYEIFESAMRQAGVIVAREPEEILDYTKALITLPPMQGNKVAVITFTGAGGIILVDAFKEEKLELAQISAAARAKIEPLYPQWMPVNNPLDIWPALMKHGMNSVYRLVLEEVLRDPAVDGVICIAIAPELPAEAHLDATSVIKEVAASSDKPVVGWLYGPNQTAMTERLEDGGKVVGLPTLPRAARTLGALYRRYQFLRKGDLAL